MAVSRSTSSTRVVRKGAKATPRQRLGASGKGQPITARCIRALLPGLHRHAQGRVLRPQAFRAWCRRRLAGKGWCVPTVEEAGRLLRTLSQNRKVSGDTVSLVGAWKPTGVRYIDPEGLSDVSNLVGFQRGTNWVSWHEYGSVYRVQRPEQEPTVPSRGGFNVTCSSAFRRLSCTVTKRSLQVHANGENTEFKGSVVIDPRRAGIGSVAPEWTLIFLHSFSCKGADYLDFPHYFCISGAPIRTVLPSAPQMEQTCFKDWKVWRGNTLGWRRIKFNSWFNYLTDKAGRSENKIDLGSLLIMRERLHCIIRAEVLRMGGDPKRVIIGGASQGCCAALDAAMTYPEELGGVIGLVGHPLGCTPLDPAKRNMPLHLFHEASDREMNWRWVKDTIKRLVDGGFNVISRRERDPTGSGHWIGEIEGPWIRSALRQIVFRGSASSSA